MRELVSLTWERDPEGYLIEERDGELAVCPRGDRTEQYEPFKVGTDTFFLFQKFAGLDQVPEAVIEFANNYGLLHSSGDPESLVDIWYFNIQSMRRLVDAWHQKDFDGLIQLYRTARFGEVSLELARDPGREAPRIRIRTTDLLNAMRIQLAQAVSMERQIRQCLYCQTPFEFGSGTGRRSTAKYCSPKCQKAHSYRLKLEAGT